MRDRKGEGAIAKTVVVHIINSFHQNRYGALDGCFVTNATVQSAAMENCPH
jgi:hypothetical protein